MARAWFAPKTVGIGSSWPISWQGWVAVIGFFAGIALSAKFLHGWPLGVSLTALVCAFAFICCRNTEGGWRIRP
jgi:hypothetical protein